MRYYDGNSLETATLTHKMIEADDEAIVWTELARAHPLPDPYGLVLGPSFDNQAVSRTGAAHLVAPPAEINRDLAR